MLGRWGGEGMTIWPAVYKYFSRYIADKFKMPKLSKGHNSGNIVYKVAFPIAIFTRAKFYYGGKICYFPGGNSTTGKYQSFFRGGRGGGGF